MRTYTRHIIPFILILALSIFCLPALYAQGAASFSISGDADSRAVDLGFSVYWADANFDNSRFYGENQTEFSGWTNWRRPHKNEIEELKDNCTYSRNADGYNYIATSNFNGASINIPKSGYRSSSLDLTTDYSRRAYFWSDTQHTRLGLDHMMYCYCIEEDLDVTVASYSRYVVMPIRLVIDKYTIAVTDGDISDSSPFPKGTAVTITANPDDCHTFVKWQKKNASMTWEDVPGATNATLNVTVEANAEYRAVFSLKNISVEVIPNNDTYGSVIFSGGLAYHCGDEISMTAMPNRMSSDCYEFVKWVDSFENEYPGTSNGSGVNMLTTTISQYAPQITYTAVFAEKTSHVEVINGTISVDDVDSPNPGDYPHCQRLVITADDPGDDCMVLDYWEKRTSEGTTRFDGTPQLPNVYATQDVTYEAFYKQKTVDITVTTEDIRKGSVSIALQDDNN